MELYVVRNRDGKYFRAKGIGGYGDSWVDELERARIYTKASSAKAQITFWATNYPDYGTPDLVILEAKIKEVVPQDERVKGVVKAAKKRDVAYRKKQAEFEIKRLQREIEADKATLENLLDS